MGAVIGNSSFFPTWGAFRRPIMTVDSFASVYSHNIVWNNGFRTTAGNGFVARDPSFPYTGGPTLSLNPSLPTHFFLSGALDHIQMNQAEADELIGSVVTSAGGSFTLTADYLDGTGQDISSTTYSDPPLTIIKLTPF